MGLINKDILNIVFQLVFRNRIKNNNNEYSTLVCFNDFVKHIRFDKYVYNWRNLLKKHYKYVHIYNRFKPSEYPNERIVAELPKHYF